MKKLIFLFLLLPFLVRGQESGFHGYGDIFNVSTVSSDTFEVSLKFTGGNYIDGQYLVDSLMVNDWFFISCTPYQVTSISVQNSGIGIFRIYDTIS